MIERDNSTGAEASNGTVPIYLWSHKRYSLRSLAQLSWHAWELQEWQVRFVPQSQYRPAFFPLFFVFPPNSGMRGTTPRKDIARIVQATRRWARRTTFTRSDSLRQSSKSCRTSERVRIPTSKHTRPSYRTPYSKSWEMPVVLEDQPLGAMTSSGFS
ncbi:hypothetical protein BJV74DRAFT_807393, partial [Russula compacta]